MALSVPVLGGLLAAPFPRSETVRLTLPVPIFWTATISAAAPFRSWHRPDAVQKRLHMASRIPMITTPVPRPKQPRPEPNQYYISGSYESIGHGLNCGTYFETDRPLDLEWLLVKCPTCGECLHIQVGPFSEFSFPTPCSECNSLLQADNRIPITIPTRVAVPFAIPLASREIPCVQQGVFMLPLIDDSTHRPDFDDTPVLLAICPTEEGRLDAVPIPVAVVGRSPQ
jgi:hypothetical protein